MVPGSMFSDLTLLYGAGSCDCFSNKANSLSVMSHWVGVYSEMSVLHLQRHSDEQVIHVTVEVAMGGGRRSGQRIGREQVPLPPCTLPPHSPSLNTLEELFSTWRWKVHNQCPHEQVVLLQAVDLSRSVVFNILLEVKTALKVSF